MRLGLALHKTRKEIRALDATEYRDWELMYLLEPWGWQNQEYLVGKILSGMFYIANKGKKKFLPKDFMRDMLSYYEVKEVPTKEERDAYIDEHRDELRTEIKRQFGL